MQRNLNPPYSILHYLRNNFLSDLFVLTLLRFFRQGELGYKLRVYNARLHQERASQSSLGKLLVIKQYLSVVSEHWIVHLQIKAKIGLKRLMIIVSFRIDQTSTIFEVKIRLLSSTTLTPRLRTDLYTFNWFCMLHCINYTLYRSGQVLAYMQLHNIYYWLQHDTVENHVYTSYYFYFVFNSLFTSSIKPVWDGVSTEKKTNWIHR